MTRSNQLQERLIDFGATVVKNACRLPRSYEWRHIKEQLIRSGTSPAAHYAEARGAESRRDFVHKLQVSLKELREADVWMRMAGKIQDGTIQPALVSECDELIAIVVKSIVTAKGNDDE